jgi:hypothetical protein
MAHPDARTDRASEERHERRRRFDGNLDRTFQLTLAIPDKARDSHPDHDFRWINDDGNRMYAKTQLDDWDTVPEVDPITVGTDREGRPMKAHLCMKRKDFCAEDQARKMADLKEQEMGMIQGARDAASRSDLPDELAYVPKDGKNSINRGVSKG